MIQQAHDIHTLVEAANTLARKQRFEEALGYYQKALSINPKDMGVLANVIATFYLMGDFDKAIDRYKLLIESNPNDLTSAYNYLSCLSSAQKLDVLQIEVDRLADSEDYSDDQLSGMFVKQAISFYVQGNFKATNQALVKAVKVDDNPTIPDRRALKAYYIFLKRLLDYTYNPREQSDALLYMLGDSHVLSAAHKCIHDYKVVPLLNQGCKAWHLATPAYNQYKRSFEILLEQVPEDSKLINSFGEIDCRHDGGIFSQYKKIPGLNLEKEISGLVQNYTSWVSHRLSTKNIHPIFVGVPASNANLTSLSDEDTETFFSVIKLFNQSLHGICEKQGWSFVDILTFTQSESGNVDSEIYIDDFHLLPNVYCKALEQLISA